MKTLKTLSILLLLLTTQTVSWAQKLHKVSGEYIYYVPDNVTLEQAKHTALDRAKNQLIENEFGTAISSTNITMISNENSNTNVRMTGLNVSEIKGDWIETIGEPKFEVGYENEMLFIKVTIAGKIRETATSSIDVKAKLLKNGTSDKFEDSRFRNGDNMYVSFQSPVNGYLTIYLHDGSDTVFCLLPYQGQRNGQYPIEAQKQYVFFSADHTQGIPSHLIDEYVLTCSSGSELNQLYIIFSPNIFTKAVDTLGDSSEMPRLLEFNEFQQWLSKCRTKDPQMILSVKEIAIFE